MLFAPISRSSSPLLGHDREEPTTTELLKTFFFGRKRVSVLVLLGLTACGLFYLQQRPTVRFQELPVSLPAASSPTTVERIKRELPPGWTEIVGDPSPIAERLPHNTAPASVQDKVFSPHCADLWVSEGRLCVELASPGADGTFPLQKHAGFDVVYTWTNGECWHRACHFI